MLRAAGLEPGEGRVGMLAERAADGDQRVHKALREAGTAMGIALTGTVNLLDVEHYYTPERVRAAAGQLSLPAKAAFLAAARLATA